MLFLQSSVQRCFAIVSHASRRCLYLPQEHEAAKEELNAKERELAEAEAAASQPQQRLRLDGEAIDQLMDQLNSMRLVSEREEERVNQLTTQLTKISANLEDNENLLKEYM